jgi:hypothetical protein
MTEEVDGEKLFHTEFVNERVEDVMLMEYEKTMAIIKPGAHFAIHSMSPTTSYARYSSITYKPDGTVELKENPRWAMPPSWTLPGKKVVEIFNESGASAECFRFGDNRWVAYRGIPRLAVVEINEQIAFYRRIHIRTVEERTPDPARKGYLKTSTRLVTEKELRPFAEVLEIRNALEARAIEGVRGSLQLPDDVKRLLKEK